MKRYQICGILGLLILVQLAGSNIYSRSSLKDREAEFIYFQRLIFLRMRVNDQGGLLFLLDTGASASAIDLKAAQRLGLPITGMANVEGTAGVIEAKKAQVRSIGVGKERVKDLSIPAYDLSGFLAPEGMHLDGILGYDFLRFFSVHIDFLNREIVFRRVAEKPARNGDQTVPFVLDNGIPRIHALLNDTVAADFRLDTGASLFETSDLYLNITQKVWSQLSALDSDLKPQRYFSGSGVGGDVKLPVAGIKRFSTGDIVVSSPFVIVQPQRGYFARSEAVGFVSNNFLERFSTVTINYPERKLYLSKN